MTEEELQKMENLIRSAMAEMIVDEEILALSDLLECLKLIDHYL